MASYSITARDGYTFVTFRTATAEHTLGFPSGMASQRRIIDAWARWAYFLAEEGDIPFSLAESLVDVLEARAEAYLPAPIRWLRRLSDTKNKRTQP